MLRQLRHHVCTVPALLDPADHSADLPLHAPEAIEHLPELGRLHVHDRSHLSRYPRGYSDELTRSFPDPVASERVEVLNW